MNQWYLWSISISREEYRQLRDKWFQDQEYKESDTFKDQKHRIGMAVDGQGIYPCFISR